MFSPAKLLSPVFLMMCFSWLSCKNRVELKTKEIVIDVAEMDEKVKTNIENIIEAVATTHYLQDSTSIVYHAPLKYLYEQNQHEAFWSSKKNWTLNAIKFLAFLDTAERNGLYKEDYHYEELKKISYDLDTDSIKKIDAVLWANADVLFSDAFAGVLKDLKQGRLIFDSASFRNDTSKYAAFFNINFKKLKEAPSFESILEEAQPKHIEYKKLKLALRNFADSMDSRVYTYLKYPDKDSLSFLLKFKRRMQEEGITIGADVNSIELKAIVKKYQTANGLVVDGKIGAGVIKKLNLTDRYKFNVVAITLDKYKLLPSTMPEKYIWVNLPSFYLKLWSADTVALVSKIICGKPTTPTPHITSAINNMVIYPTWTVPNSIITKEMLPGLKRNPSYLVKKGLYVLNGKGEQIDATSINWAKYTKGIPFLIQQGSGDDNALGVIKFNFENPFSVYLHDTNQRYLFKNSVRSLSHGCVRVQEWQKLADFIARNDSANWSKPEPVPYNTDSIRSWINQKQKHTVAVKNKIPLYIRYYSCEPVNGRLKFYDDIYGEDKALKSQFFAAK